MKEKLLLVDDNPSVLQVLQVSFQFLGYTIFTARDGIEAEIMLEKCHPDLLILDVMMPGKNGFAVCRDLKRNPHLASLPVILLTAKTEEEDVCWGLDCGADAYVTKPYEPRQLEALVRQLLDDARAGRRSFAWTGLPSDTRVVQEAVARREAGGVAVLLEAKLPDSSVEAYCMKYGQARFRQMVHALGWMLVEEVRNRAPGGLVGQRADDTFFLLLGAEEGEKLRAELTEASQALIGGYYSEDDRVKGGILFKDPITHSLDRIPLMHLEWQPREAAERMAVAAGS